jgi:hypothetical protein
VKIEPDIDYYKDVAAHGLLKVITNWINRGLTDRAPGLRHAMDDRQARRAP